MRRALLVVALLVLSVLITSLVVRALPTLSALTVHALAAIVALLVAFLALAAAVVAMLVAFIALLPFRTSFLGARVQAFATLVPFAAVTVITGTSCAWWNHRIAYGWRRYGGFVLILIVPFLIIIVAIIQTVLLFVVLLQHRFGILCQGCFISHGQCGDRFVLHKGWADGLGAIGLAILFVKDPVDKVLLLEGIGLLQVKRLGDLFQLGELHRCELCRVKLGHGVMLGCSFQGTGQASRPGGTCSVGGSDAMQPRWTMVRGA